jgi:uncharacterized protein YndB with AHSA1/START domain/uncharacterized protein YciI
MGGTGQSEKRIVKQAAIPASRKDVWLAFTTPEGVSSFFASGSWIELRPGGPYEIYFNMEEEPGFRGSEGCRILSYLDQEMLSFTWNAPTQFSDVRWRRTFVVVQLADAGPNATNVTLTHAGWKEGGQWDQVFDYFDRAWDMVLKNLRTRFESGPLGIIECAQAQIPPDMKHYVYFIRPRRSGFFDQPTQFEMDTVSKHAQYIAGLLAQGKLILAGPCFEPSYFPEKSETAGMFDIPTPGIVIFKEESDDKAREIMENDPAVQAGVFKAKVCQFNFAFGNFN